MIPIGDSAPRGRTPWVNYSIVVACVLVFLVELALGNRLDAFIRQWGVTPVFVSSALAGDLRASQTVLLTLVTALFLHGGWLHLGGNVLFLWVFGDNVEERFGHIRYLLFYLACGAGANLAQVAVASDSRIPLIGASGAIAAVLGSYILMFPRARVTVLIPVFFIPLFLPVPAVVMLGVWFVTQLANGLATITTHAQMSGGVGYWAHIGGFVLGALATLVVPKARTAEQTYRPLELRSPHELRQASRVGAVAIRTLTLAGDVINILLTLRIVFMFLNLPEEGPFAVAIRLVYGLSWPLVEPFTDFLPYLEFSGHILELYAVLAFVVYYGLVTVIVWGLGLLVSRKRPLGR